MNIELHHIGFVSRSHGFKGEVMLAFEEGEPDDFGGVEFIFIDHDHLQVPYFVQKFSVGNGNAIVKFEDVENEEQARKLSGKRIYVEKKFLPRYLKTKKEIGSLIDFFVIDKVHGELGQIKNLAEQGQHFIAQLFFEGKEILIPLAEDLITKIDKRAKKIYVDLPSGLLDLYLGKK